MLCLTPLAKLNTNCNNFPRLKKCPLVARENMEWGWFAKNTTNIKTVLSKHLILLRVVSNIPSWTKHPPKIGNARYDVYCLTVFIVSRCFYSHANKPKLRPHTISIKNCTTNVELIHWQCSISCNTSSMDLLRQGSPTSSKDYGNAQKKLLLNRELFLLMMQGSRFPKIHLNMWQVCQPSEIPLLQKHRKLFGYTSCCMRDETNFSPLEMMCYVFKCSL